MFSRTRMDRALTEYNKSFKLNPLTTVPGDKKNMLTKSTNDLLMELKSVVVDYQGKVSGRMEKLQTQMDALDLRGNGAGSFGAPANPFIKALEENESVTRLLADKRGAAVITLKGRDAEVFMSRKTTILSGPGGNVGIGGSGVLPIGREPEITPEARPQLTVRDLLSSSTTTFQVIDYVKVLQPMGIASPQAEGSVKAENAVTFTTASARVQTIATWIPASKQVLDDMADLRNFLITALPYYVDLEEQVQLLSGDGTGNNILGLIPQASAFNTSLLSVSGGWTRLDQIGRVIQQITTANELQPTFLILHPTDFWSIRLTKDGFGRYILGDPQQAGIMTTGGFVLTPTTNLFGLTILVTTSISQGLFLVGSGSPIASEIKDRMEMQVEISTEHADYFTRNLIAIRAEKRLAFLVRRPASYIAGTFTTSPAGQ